MNLKCDSCAAPLEEKQIDEERALARCAFCGAVMDLSRRAGPGPGGRTFRDLERPEVPLPEKFRLEKDGGGIRISWRWFTPAAVFLAFFAVVWNGFLIAFFGMAAASGAPGVFFLFPLIHVAVGVGIGYFALASFLNTTTVSVGGGTVAVRHGPLPWFGNRVLTGREVDQLFCAQKVSHGKHGVSVTHEVNAVLKAGKRLTLLKGLQLDQALFVEQRLERQLGIKDRAVGGEVRRDGE